MKEISTLLNISNKFLQYIKENNFFIETNGIIK